MRRYFSLLFFFFLLNNMTWANGGPVDGSAVYALGDIRPVRMAPVGMVSETLEMQIDGDFTHVRVQYQLQNIKVNLPQVITYGFPVEVAYSEYTEDMNWREEYIPELNFLLDGKPLEITREVEQGVETRPVEGQIEGIETRKIWYVTDFMIPAGKLVTLDVIYVVKNGYTDWETSKSALPSYDMRRLFYDFSAAKYWGNGILPKLDVSLEFPEDTEASIKGLTMLPKPTANAYTFSGINLVLNDLPSLYFEYSVEPAKLSTHFREKRIPASELVDIRASSTLPGNYGIEHLVDQDFSTAWVEGDDGAGVGTRIEIRLDDVMPLTAIGLVNGYTKSESTYVRNNRIKRIRIDLTARVTYENNKLETQSFEMTLPDRPFQRIDENNFGVLLDIPYDTGEGAYGREVQKVVLTILDVYRGSRYNDTCISELFLLR